MLVPPFVWPQFLQLVSERALDQLGLNVNSIHIYIIVLYKNREAFKVPPLLPRDSRRLLSIIKLSLRRFSHMWMWYET